MEPDIHWSAMSGHVSTFIVNGGRYNKIFWTEQFNDGMGHVLDAISTPVSVDLANIPRFNESEGHGPKRAHPVEDYFDDMAMHLMKEALNILRQKGHKISKEEQLGAVMAILLHDIGHGPFSHALEHSIVGEIDHEFLSQLMMKQLNHQYNGALTTGIEIFNHQYKKSFLSQLVSSQLDMDRLDYLTRDSFFTGVSEGVIGTQRLIKMLNVADDNLLIEEKGIYSVEKFIVARRIMYWQVYLHKTVLAAETMLIRILDRARLLCHQGVDLFATPALAFFLNNDIRREDVENNPEILEYYARLDDFDIFTAIKVWTGHDDYILSTLCQALVNRKLFRCEIQLQPFEYFYIENIRKNLMENLNVDEKDLKYFFVSESTSNYAYKYDTENIQILAKKGKILDLTEASDQFANFSDIGPVTKHFICYPKAL
jgi:HD superfamily phosphohydrolase